MIYIYCAFDSINYKCINNTACKLLSIVLIHFRISLDLFNVTKNGSAVAHFSSTAQHTGKSELANGIKESPEGLQESPKEFQDSHNGIQQSTNGIQQSANGIQQSTNGTQQSTNGVQELNKTSLPSPRLEKLPTPGFLGKTTSNVRGSSVFANPFAEEENAKQALLEKHVKMVNSKDNAKLINGKKICWNYRKGRCRFGHNCKYAHDSDLQKTKEELLIENQTQQVVLCQNQDLPQPSLEELKEIKAEAVTMNGGKRKRPGLSQGIVPGKKVMNKYRSQKKKPVG